MNYIFFFKLQVAPPATTAAPMMGGLPPQQPQPTPLPPQPTPPTGLLAPPHNQTENKIPNADFLQHQMTAAKAGTYHCIA